MKTEKSLADDYDYAKHRSVCEKKKDKRGTPVVRIEG
jgi:hypothetical protein